MTDVSSLLTLERNREILAQIPPSLRCFGKWFLAISEIPHATFHCADFISTLISWISLLGIASERDPHGNVCARIPSHGLPESAPTVAIQAHTDMIKVGEFLESGAIEVSLKDGRLIAEKSTLGADDGVGVALMLEVIERREELVHGPMEFIFTADEEQGLIGLHKLAPKAGPSEGISPFRAKYLINCDALNFERIVIGSKGAVIYRLRFEVHRRPTESKSVIEIDLSGLKGGHSGGCVHLNRMNAIKVIVRILKLLIQKGVQLELVDFDGGEQMNIIPRLAKAAIAVSPQESDAIIEQIERFAKEIFAESVGKDENAPQFSVRVRPSSADDLSLSFEETKKILNVALVYQFGPLRWSPVFPEYVDTSDNLGVFRFNGNVIEITTSPRSAIQSKLDEADQMIRAICEMSGFEYTITPQPVGGPWTPNLDSRLARAVADSFEKLTGGRKRYGITQVTIEPAEFLVRGYDFDMVALSPSVPKAHTIGEYLNIAETITWREVVFDVLAGLSE